MNITLIIIGGLIIFIVGYIGGYIFGRNSRKDIDKTIADYMEDDIEVSKKLGKAICAMNDFLNTLFDSHINHVGYCEEELAKLEQSVEELKEKKKEKRGYAIFDDD